MTKRIFIITLALALLCPSIYAAKKKDNKGGGAKKVAPELTITPETRICFAMYTVHNKTMRMNVQFYPLQDKETRTVFFEVKNGTKWQRIAKTTIREDDYGYDDGQKIWLAQFSIKDWDTAKNRDYRIVALDGIATYEGIIRRDPVDKDEITVAAFTGNTSKDKQLKPDIIANIKAQDPDLLFFSGDQIYIKKNHLDDWLLFGRQFGPIIKDRPTICIPDDHDVGNGNLWGEGGNDWGEGGNDSGSTFKKQGYGNPEFVRMVELVQTGNLPLPYDPTPIKRNIGVYYTSLRIGRVDFAIIEDRKFKTSPATLDEYLTTIGISNSIDENSLDKNFSGSAKDLDLPNGKLLGQRQLDFLEDWGTQWNGVNLKAVLSQTVFNKAHSAKKYDLDANGWPQSGRNRAVDAMRKCFALHINGDQHLGTISQYGLETWRDGSHSFCVPSIANHFPRSWKPKQSCDGEKWESVLEYTGDYFDDFNNRITMKAYVNPDKSLANKWGEWGAKAEGYGLIRFNVKTRDITMECWPRGVDVTKNPEQYKGWPIVINQQDNYGRKATGWLPTIQIKGMADPVVQVIDEATGKSIYTLRIKGNSFNPKVFSKGPFTLRVGELETDKMKTFKGIKPSNSMGAKKVSITI